MWKKIMLSITAIMWVLAFGQLFFVDKGDTHRARQEVFHVIEEEKASYKVSVIGPYKGDFLTRAEEKTLLAQWVERIGLSSGKFLCTDNDEGHITYLTINGDNIAGYGKIITKEKKESKQSIVCKQYVCFDFTSKKSLTSLRENLESLVKQEKIGGIPIYCAEYESKTPLSKERQNELTDSLAKAMGGTIVSSFAESEINYVYGYSRQFSYSQKIDGINMNFLIYMKPTDTGKTRVHVQYPTVSLT